MKVERVGDGFDELAEVVLEGRAGEDQGFAVSGVISGNPEDDELEWIPLGGIERVQKVFCSRNLRDTGIVRRKGELAGERI